MPFLKVLLLHFGFPLCPHPTSDKLDITAVPTEDNKDFKIANSINFELKLIDGNGKAVKEAKKTHALAWGSVIYYFKTF